jgi:hypothetical protein
MRRLAEDLDERLGTAAKRDFETHYSEEVTGKAWLNLIESLTSARA